MCASLHDRLHWQSDFPNMGTNPVDPDCMNCAVQGSFPRLTAGDDVPFLQTHYGPPYGITGYGLAEVGINPLCEPVVRDNFIAPAQQQSEQVNLHE